MKILVIGGTSGLGLAITEKYNADQVSRSTGYTIPDKINEVVELSLGYDIIINCLPDSNQNSVLHSTVTAHASNNLNTYFITIGSTSWRINDIGHSKRDLFEWNQKFFFEKTSVRHTMLNPAYLWHNTENGIFEPIPKDDILNVIDFLIKQSYTSKSVIPLIDIKGLYNVNR
jgi:hypothetical protein